MTENSGDISQVAVALPNGNPVSCNLYTFAADNPSAVVVIAHGAGGGPEQPFLSGFARALSERHAITTVRFAFPYRQLGRKLPGPASHALAAWNAVRDHVAAQHPSLPLWCSGKSYGGRMASLAVASGMDCEGLFYLGFPLHAPGKPEKPRGDHLVAITVPQLFLEGTKDPFVVPHEQLQDLVEKNATAQLEWVEGANHSFEVAGNKRPADEIGESLVPLVAAFVLKNRGSITRAEGPGAAPRTQPRRRSVAAPQKD